MTESLKNVIDSLNSLEEIDIPTDYNDKLHKRLVIEKENNSPNKWKTRTKYIGYASTAVAGLLVLFIAFQSGGLVGIFDKSRIAYVSEADLDNHRDLNNKVSDTKSAVNINPKPDINTDEVQVQESVNFQSLEITIDEIKEEPEMDKNKEVERNKEIEQVVVLNDLEDDNLIDSITPKETFMIANSFDSNEAEINSININTIVVDIDEFSTKIISTVSNLGGNIVQLDNTSFAINIDALRINSLINWISNNSDISLNTFDGVKASGNLTINLKIIQ